MWGKWDDAECSRNSSEGLSGLWFDRGNQSALESMNSEWREIIIFDSTNNIKKRLDENVNSKKDITNGGICVGTKIKVLKDPFFGHFGIVTKIINDEVTFESGVICRALQIKLENGEITLVPKANIEVI